MKIAIIGASSFLGQHFIQLLKTQAHELYLYSRKNTFEQDASIHWQCYNFPTTVLDYKKLSHFDAIYYCAGAGIQPKHQDNNQQIYELNAFEPIRLISALKDLKFTGKVITFGSYFEIGNHSESRNYTEDELATHSNPLPNAYCTAKNLLTRFVHTELRQADQLGFHLQHFVLTNIYGVQENSHRLMHYIVQSSKKGDALSFTSGLQQRQYTHIKDIVNFLSENLQNNQSGIFNLTNDQTISVREVIETVLKIVEQELGIQPQVTFGSENKRDVNMKYLGLNTRHLQNCFNFEPKISLEEGIKEYLI